MTRAHFDDEIAQGHNIDIHTIYTSKCSKIQTDVQLRRLALNCVKVCSNGNHLVLRKKCKIKKLFKMMESL